METLRQAGPSERLSVRVGVGLGPAPARSAVGSPDFWRLVDTLEDVGYDSLWLSDTAGRGGPAPLPVLAAVAARTERLKLGTNVLALPTRNPLHVARDLATVDALSAGRLLPAGGLGLGEPGELAAAGVRREDRAARLEESVGMIKALWGGEPVTIEGRFWTLADVAIAPKPHRAQLELWLGGRVPAALRRIGRIADGWLASFMGPEQFGAGVDLIRASAVEHGRSIDEDHYGTTVFSAPSAQDVSPRLGALLDLQPGVERTDHVACGADETAALLDRFIAQGATKFVLVPLGAEPDAWLRELFPRVVAPLEAAGVTRT